MKRRKIIMKIVSVGTTYRIYGDDLKTYDKLPAGTYKAEFTHDQASS
ncbi:hypothetical protein BCP12_038 [Bacillus phage BCP12]|uniref:Uncharacterized protein n=1 Tax=Bacillus phage BCP12 TaxID=1913122 RepID=A0A2S0CSK5_9CAUD|nr:hypothetical protein BCP12_038 [Bacillus phage BCP12]